MKNRAALKRKLLRSLEQASIKMAVFLEMAGDLALAAEGNPDEEEEVTQLFHEIYLEVDDLWYEKDVFKDREDLLDFVLASVLWELQLLGALDSESVGEDEQSEQS